MLKLLFGICSMIIAFVFVFFVPMSGMEAQIITTISAIAGSLGIISWRNDYELLKGWFKSKTIFGSLIVVVPIMVLAITPLIGIDLAEWLKYLAYALIIGGGGTTIIGIILTPKDNPTIKK